MGHEYQARLQVLGLFSVRGRLIRSDMIKIWKAFNGMGTGLLETFERQMHASTRGHSCKLSVPICHGELRRRFWNVRCVALWNALPADIVEAASLDVFKRALDGHLQNLFFEIDK